jgi:hypothetical protein
MFSPVGRQHKAVLLPDNIVFQPEFRYILGHHDVFRAEEHAGEEIRLDLNFLGRILSSDVYLWLCLCGNKDKFSRLEHDILIKEENEVLREKYVEILKNCKTLIRRAA